MGAELGVTESVYEYFYKTLERSYSKIAEKNFESKQFNHEKKIF